MEQNLFEVDWRGMTTSAELETFTGQIADASRAGAGTREHVAELELLLDYVTRHAAVIKLTESLSASVATLSSMEDAIDNYADSDPGLLHSVIDQVLLSLDDAQRSATISHRFLHPIHHHHPSPPTLSIDCRWPFAFVFFQQDSRPDPSDSSCARGHCALGGRGREPRYICPTATP